MFKRIASLYLASVLLTTPLYAADKSEQTLPSQDFWDYMTDFSDEDDRVLDPLEYDELLRMKDDFLKDENNMQTTGTQHLSSVKKIYSAATSSIGDAK